MAAERRRIDPQHPDWFISEGSAWRLMERLHDIDPLEADTQLAAGAGTSKWGANNFIR